MAHSRRHRSRILPPRPSCGTGSGSSCGSPAQDTAGKRKIAAHTEAHVCERTSCSENPAGLDLRNHALTNYPRSAGERQSRCTVRIAHQAGNLELGTQALKRSARKRRCSGHDMPEAPSCHPAHKNRPEASAAPQSSNIGVAICIAGFVLTALR